MQGGLKEERQHLSEGEGGVLCVLGREAAFSTESKESILQRASKSYTQL